MAIGFVDVGSAIRRWNDFATMKGNIEMMVIWPKEHERFLSEAVKEGAGSNSQLMKLINDKFGTSYTRSGISGKIHRLGLSNKTGLPKAVKKPSPKRTTPYIHRTPPRSIVEPPPDAESLNMTLLEMERGMCYWPTGDGLYCGLPTTGGRVTYCGKHHRAGTEPAKYRGPIWSVNKRGASR